MVLARVTVARKNNAHAIEGSGYCTVLRAGEAGQSELRVDAMCDEF